MIRIIIAPITSGRAISNPSMFANHMIRTCVLIILIYIIQLNGVISPSLQSETTPHLQSSIYNPKVKRGSIPPKPRSDSIEISSRFSGPEQETWEKREDVPGCLTSKSSADVDNAGVSEIQSNTHSSSRSPRKMKRVLDIKSRHGGQPLDFRRRKTYENSASLRLQKQSTQMMLSKVKTAHSVLTKVMGALEISPVSPPTVSEKDTNKLNPILISTTLRLTHKYMSVRAVSSDENDAISSWNLASLLSSQYYQQSLTRINQEPTIVRHPPVTLPEIWNYGREGWYKNERLIHSWKASGLPSQDKPLMITVGEALQIWSERFEETIAEWPSAPLNLGSMISEETTLGMTILTRSVPLKNYSTILRAAAHSTQQQMSDAMDWFDDLLGSEEVIRRVQVLHEGYNKASEDIVKRLATGFASRNHKETTDYKALYGEIYMNYPVLFRRAEHEILSRCTTKNVRMVSEEILMECARVYLDRGLKVNQKWPVWSYTESVQVINQLHDPAMKYIIEEHYAKDTFYMSRISQVNSIVDGIRSRLIELISNYKKGIKVDDKEIQFLTRTWKELPKTLKADTKVKMEKSLGLNSKDLSLIWRRMFERSSKSLATLWTDLFSENRLHSSIVEKLFSLLYLKSMPLHYTEAIHFMRSDLKDPSKLDLDQKITWLQEMSKNNMINVLRVCIKNFNAMAVRPGYSSAIGLDQHFLLGTCKAIYRDNLPLWKTIEDNLTDKLGEGILSRVERATQAALKQAWVHDTWVHFLDERLGYKRHEPLFDVIFKFGMALQLDKEYPTFLGISLDEPYNTFCQTPKIIKEKFKEIFHEEYEERAKLLTVLSIRQKLLSSNPEEFRFDAISNNIVVTNKKIVKWLHLGEVSVPAVVAAVLHCSSQSSQDSVSEILHQSIKATVSHQLDLFGCLKLDDKQGFEYQALLRLLSRKSHMFREDLDLENIVRIIQKHHHQIHTEFSK